jgi:hypothetical protein
MHHHSDSDYRGNHTVDVYGGLHDPSAGGVHSDCDTQYAPGMQLSIAESKVHTRYALSSGLYGGYIRKSSVYNETLLVGSLHSPGMI